MAEAPFGLITEGEAPPEGIEVLSAKLERLARSASRLRSQDISAHAREHATLVIADTLAVMVSGAGRPEYQKLWDVKARMDGCDHRGRAQLATDSTRRVDPQLAAFVNGSAANVLDLNELVSGGGMGGHPAVHIVPAALAMAQTLGSSGAELIEAVIAGYEVDARLFDLLTFRSAVHPHGNIASIGAAVAVAKLCGSDAGTAALVASSLPLLSLWELSLEGATVHQSLTGFGASLGVTSCWLAQAGFAGSRRALTIAYTNIMGSIANPDALDGDLDPSSLAIEKNLIKVYSCCARAFPPIEAALAVEGMNAQSIESIVVDADPLVVKLTARGDPRNSLAARFSLEYAVATSLLHRSGGPEAFELDPAAVALARKVRVQVRDDFADGRGISHRRARVTVNDDLGVHVGEAEGGHIGSPREDPRFMAKLESLARDPLTGESKLDLERVLHLADLAEVGDLLSPK